MTKKGRNEFNIRRGGKEKAKKSEPFQNDPSQLMTLNTLYVICANIKNAFLFYKMYFIDI